MLSEKNIDAILTYAFLNEMSEGDINQEVFSYLDKNFLRSSATTTGEDGGPATLHSVVWLDNNKQPYKVINLEKLFYIVQDKFKNLCSDNEERDKRLKEIVQAWYSKKYNKDTGNILI